MRTENEYSLQDLADRADVSPRTIRYYVAQGLLPSPGQSGPGARYTDGHLARLRLIRRLQREHLPLAEIRTQLASLDDHTVANLVETDVPAAPEGSALDYVRAILAGGGVDARRSVPVPANLPTPARRKFLVRGTPGVRRPAFLAEPGPSWLDEGEPPQTPNASQPPAPAKPSSTEPIADRSQWDRVTFTPDIELHIRRPLSRQQNKRVDRLIAIARELLEEDPS
jgi:DNA-binding transcriptional MerR regulator